MALPLLGAHSWFSLMDGARSPADLVDAASAFGWSALALADTNNFHALPEVVDAAAAGGIKAIAAASIETGGLSFRAYCLDRRGFARLGELLTKALAVEVPRRRLHLPSELLDEEAAGAEDEVPEGEGPRAGRADGSPRGGIGAPRQQRPDAPARPADASARAASARGARASAQGGDSSSRPAEAYDPIAELRGGGWEGLAIASADPAVLGRLAGGGRLFAALPLGYPQEGTARAARELKLPLLAEHPARFVGPADAELWNLARAIEERRTLGAPWSAGPQGAAGPPGALLVAESRARALLSAFPEALCAAEALVEEAAPASSFFADPPVFPAYKGLPDGEAYYLLRSLCEAGVPGRYGSAPPAGLKPRLERELAIIRSKGFSSYFLVVRDIVRRCPRTCGRGSAASSLVSYLLGLTHVDPLAHDLFFERFLNEGRRDPPDIDIDFPWDERPALLKSVFEEYGGRAAMVANHCALSERSSLRETALALGMNEEDVAGAGRALRLGRLDTLAPELLRLARLVRGMPRYIGTHCGGVVITPGPITDWSHVQLSPAGLPVLAWEKDGTERAGLVKIDLLGNRSLAVLRDCITQVNLGTQENLGAQVNLEWDFRGADEDPAARALVESGRTMGVFYVESPATRQLLLKMGTVDYGRLVAASSIIRPAANKWISEYVRRLRGGSWRRLPAAVEETLAETYGIMVYQEDVSRVAMAAAGFDAVLADGLRKALTKKRKGVALEDFKERFLAGCAASGVDGRDSAELWDMMLSFDGYSFCKAHSASYALVSYRLAWMKAHHPAIFMAAVINNGGGFYGTQAYLGEARRLGIGLLPPHVNASAAEYAVEGGDALRVGLSQLAGLSRRTIEGILASRGERGAFASLEDFDARVAPTLPELRALVRSGCLDGLPARAGGPPLCRPQALWALHRGRALAARAGGRRAGRAPAAGRGPASGGSPRAGHGPAAGYSPAGYSPAVPELLEDEWAPPEWVKDYPRSARLADEARLLGLVLRGAPAALFSERAALVAGRRGLPAPSLSGCLPWLVGERVCLAGSVVAGKEVLSRDGRPMAFYTFEDEEGLFETALFPQAYARALPTLEANTAILVAGTARSEYGAITVHVEEAFGLNK
jgi:DNA polymerase III alpha subunit